MARTCTVCSSPRKKEIDQALLAGESFRHIAARYDTSTGALQRHKADHLPAKVVKSAAGKALMESESLAEQINTLRRRADVLFTDATELLERSKQNNDSKTALQAINSARACIGESRELLRLCGEMAGQLAPQGASLVVIAPLILQCFAEGGVSTEVRVAVARKLAALDRTLTLDANGNTLPA